jgi:membrane-associated phospholipid phosphatase
MYANAITRRRALMYTVGATAALSAVSLPMVARAAPSAGSVEPGAGSWRTWFISSGSDLRVPPPPDSRDELAQVRGLLGSADATMQERMAFWDAGPAPYRWNEIANEMFFSGAFGASNYGRIQAYLNMAIHDATVATWDSKYAHNRPRPSQQDSSIVPLVAVPGSPSYPSEHAAVAAAASEVLAYFAPKETEKLRNLAEEAATSRVAAGVQYPSDSAAGMDVGRAAAILAIDAARSDNYDTATWDGKVPEGPGLWKGQNPGGAADRFWKPLIVSSADVFRADPPPAFDSPERAQEVDAVKSFPRTPATTGQAYYSQFGGRGAPNYNVIYNREIGRHVLEEHLDDSPLPARIYALVHAAYHDAWITTQDTKFTYWTARPSMFDPSITTLFPNPPFPSYVSNGSALTASPSIILAHFFPRDAAYFAKQATTYGDARLWAGIHFPSDIEVARKMGEQLAAVALARDAS